MFDNNSSLCYAGALRLSQPSAIKHGLIIVTPLSQAGQVIRASVNYRFDENITATLKFDNPVSTQDSHQFILPTKFRGWDIYAYVSLKDACHATTVNPAIEIKTRSLRPVAANNDHTLSNTCSEIKLSPSTLLPNRRLETSFAIQMKLSPTVRQLVSRG